MTQEELANRIGVKKQTVQKYESGEIENVPLDKIIAIADVVGVAPIDILGMRETINNDNRIFKLMSKINSLSDEQISSLETIIDSMSNNHQKRS